LSETLNPATETVTILTPRNWNVAGSAFNVERATLNF
jgi:hypothetical protein